MHKHLNIIILAAGKGTRMSSDRPKVLHALAGKPMLRHVLDTARTLNPAKICVVYGYGAEEVLTAFADPDVQWALQQEQLGTGHALKQALPHMGAQGITLVLYGDVPLIQSDTLSKLLEAAGENRVSLLTALLDDATGYGRIVRSEAGKVVRIVEQKDADEMELAINEVNTGILAIPTNKADSWLGKLSNKNAQGEYYLTDVIAMAVAEGMAVETSHPGHDWEVLGVNSKTQLAQLERIYQGNYARDLMAQGVTLMDPARIDVRGTLTCGRDVVIDINCVFEGNVALGDNVTVGPNCFLKNLLVEKDTRIAPCTVAEDAVIGENCRIGPYARIRPGTTLAKETHIGNFVEIKNSQIGEGSKINHLSYVGDASVGKQVNIGAGTITCNYDGVDKHRTVIEDNAFIGSDTQLIAPVTVGKGATIGAGATITRDAPAGKLTLSRAKQLTIEDWKRPSKKPKEEK